MVRKKGKGAMKIQPSGSNIQHQLNSTGRKEAFEEASSLNLVLRISVLDTDISKARIAGLLGLMRKHSVQPDARCSMSLSWRKLYENKETFTPIQMLEGLTPFESYFNLRQADGALPTENKEQLASVAASLSVMLSDLRSYSLFQEISDTFDLANRDLSDGEATEILEELKTVISTSKKDLQELLPLFPKAGKGRKQLEDLMKKKINANKHYLELVQKALELIKEMLKADVSKMLQESLQEGKRERERELEPEDETTCEEGDLTKEEDLARPAQKKKLNGESTHSEMQKKKKKQKHSSKEEAALRSQEDSSDYSESTPPTPQVINRGAMRAATTQPKKTFKCPRNILEQVVGVRNCIRKNIEKETGAKIEIDEGSNPCLFHITGSKDSVENASQIVGNLIKDIKNYGYPYKVSSKAMITIRESVNLALEDQDYTIPVIVPLCFQQDSKKALKHLKRKLREKRNHS